MKTILSVLAIALTTLAVAPSANANGYYCAPRRTYCAPVFVCTRVVCSHTECRRAVNYCGECYTYHVNIVTYADIYSDGSRNTYTRVFRA
jgi:hypothetical protein